MIKNTSSRVSFLLLSFLVMSLALSSCKKFGNGIKADDEAQNLFIQLNFSSGSYRAYNKAQTPLVATKEDENVMVNSINYIKVADIYFTDNKGNIKKYLRIVNENAVRTFYDETSNSSEREYNFETNIDNSKIFDDSGNNLDNGADTNTLFASLMKKRAEGSKTTPFTEGKGIKIYDLEKDISTVAIVLNTYKGKQLLKEGENLASLKAQTTADSWDLYYCDSRDLITIGTESMSPGPQGGDAAGRKVVKRVIFGIDPQFVGAQTYYKSKMNRFQIVPKFCRIVYQDEAKNKINKWKENWKRENSGKTDDEAYEAFKAASDGLNGQTFEDYVTYFKKDQENKTFMGNPKSGGGEYSASELSELWKYPKYYKVEKITSKNKAVFMNNFSLSYDPISETWSDDVFAETYLNHFDIDQSLIWTPTEDNEKDTYISSTALYYNKDGFGENEDLTDNERNGILEPTTHVFAFNFFSKDLRAEDYARNPIIGERGKAPYIHFYFPDLDEKYRFVNIVGYNFLKGASIQPQKGGSVFNIDLRLVNNNYGPVVSSEDPDVKTYGRVDLTNKILDLSIGVRPAAWIDVNIRPKPY